MNALPVLAFLPIEDGVFILGQHLFLPWHLRIPSFYALSCLSLLGEGRREGVDHLVDQAQAFALTGFLRG